MRKNIFKIVFWVSVVAFIVGIIIISSDLGMGLITFGIVGIVFSGVYAVVRGYLSLAKKASQREAKSEREWS